jgi:hypothetical protein
MKYSYPRLRASQVAFPDEVKVQTSEIDYLQRWACPATAEAIAVAA